MTQPSVPCLQERVRHATGARRAQRGVLIQSLWSGYGEIVRFHLEGGSDPSVVVKHARPPQRPRHPRNWTSPVGHARKLQSYAVEKNFYQHWAPSLAGTSCRIPNPVEVWEAPDPDILEWLFILEDLDASGFSLRCPQPTAEQRHACLRWLADFHARFMNQPPTDLWPVGTYWHLATRPEELARQRSGPLKDAAPRLDARLAATRYPTLLHGDAKVANFCFSNGTGTGPVAAVDFQYAGTGCGMKDVAYFFSSCLEAPDIAGQAPQLLDHYFAQLHDSLAELRSPVCAEAVEAEWRDLYPFAWADFQRFLEGWAPDHCKLHDYCHSMTEAALRSL